MSNSDASISSMFDPDEINRLKKADPDAVVVLKRYFKEQQDHRLSIEKAEAEFEIKRKERELDRLDKDAVMFRIIQILGMIFAFSLIGLGMYFSYSLINGGKNMAGSLFGGGTLIAAGSIFTRFALKHLSEKRLSDVESK
ncbi:MAG: hypothetical protein ACMVP2_24655 [Imperialibacter sp.]|uniref:hypothetical protein n=1 Tax=Imperialibacter sp. TaxID=2038411 RepID=UPI003A8A08BC